MSKFNEGTSGRVIAKTLGGEYGFQTWQRLARRHYGDHCEFCQYSAATHVHHITPRSAGGINSIENAIVLCPNHHAEVHQVLRKLKKDGADLGNHFLKMGKRIDLVWLIDHQIGGKKTFKNPK
jgi:hypothetical protein